MRRNECLECLEVVQYTVGPVIIEAKNAKKRVSTEALGALDGPPVAQTKI